MMNWKFGIFWFGFSFCLCLTAPTYAKKKKDCNFELRNMTGDLPRFTIESGKTCTWKILPGDISRRGDIFLAFREFKLRADDQLEVKELDDNNRDVKLLFGPFSGYRESFSMLTGAKKLIVILRTAPDTREKPAFKRALWGFYSGDDRTVLLTVEKGVVRTPLYKESPGVPPAAIKYRFKPLNMPEQKLSVAFEDYNLKRGSISIMNSEDADGEYSAMEQPPDILASVTVTVKVTIDLSLANQSLTMILESVTAGCSQGINVSRSSDPYAVILEAPKLKDFSTPVLRHLGIDCRWFVYSTPRSIFNVHVESLTLDSNLDHVVINDGGRRESKALLQTTRSHFLLDNPQGRDFRTTTNFLWVAFRKSLIRENANFRLRVHPVVGGNWTDLSGSSIAPPKNAVNMKNLSDGLHHGTSVVIITPDMISPYHNVHHRPNMGPLVFATAGLIMFALMVAVMRRVLYHVPPPPPPMNLKPVI